MASPRVVRCAMAAAANPERLSSGRRIEGESEGYSGDPRAPRPRRQLALLA